MNSLRIRAVAYLLILLIGPVRYLLANRLTCIHEVLDTLAFAFGERE